MTTPPPIPSETSPARPPRAGMSGCAIAGIIAAVVAVVGVFVVGILAAIALPAYQDYVARARVTQSLHHAQSLEPDVDRYFDANGRCPDNRAVGLGDDATVELGATGAGRGPRAGIVVAALDDGRCAIRLTYLDLAPAVDGQTLVFESDAGEWHCLGGTLAQRYRPPEC